MKIRKNSFTLLEIFLCVAILGVSTVAIGWQMKNLLGSHHFHQNIANLITDLKKCQLLALADRADIEIVLRKNQEEYSYRLHTDETHIHFPKRPKKMKGVKQLFIEKKPIISHTINIFASGKIDQKDKIYLFRNEHEGIELDLSEPHLVKQRRISR